MQTCVVFVFYIYGVQMSDNKSNQLPDILDKTLTEAITCTIGNKTGRRPSAKSKAQNGPFLGKQKFEIVIILCLFYLYQLNIAHLKSGIPPPHLTSGTLPHPTLGRREFSPLIYCDSVVLIGRLAQPEQNIRDNFANYFLF